MYNGSTFSFKNSRDADFLLLILSVHPNIAEYSWLESQLMRPNHVDTSTFDAVANYLRKRRTGANYALMSVSNYSQDIIISVRGKGYRLNTADDWFVMVQNEYDTDAESDQALEIISGIVDKVIAIEERLRFINRDGVLTLDIAGYEKEIEDLHDLFLVAGDKIAGAINASGDFLKVARVLVALENMESYILMRRSGARLTEEQWRMLFRKELIGILDTIHNLINGR